MKEKEGKAYLNISMKNDAWLLWLLIVVPVVQQVHGWLLENLFRKSALEMFDDAWFA